mgnify:FL=1
MICPIPDIPWQITGNHWVTLPCIHPADASIHAIGTVHAASRGAIEFAGGPEFVEGKSAPLIGFRLSVDGNTTALGEEGMAWEREVGWIPSFSTKVGDITVRGVMCAPFGRNAETSGVVVEFTLENRSSKATDCGVWVGGTLGHRQLRVRTPRAFGDAHQITPGESGSVVLEGGSAESPVAIAIGGDGEFEVTINESESPSWTMTRRVSIPAGLSETIAL